MPTATQGQDSIQVDAPPELVYDVIADVTRMGERSPECYRCEWLDNAAGPQVGARFKGYNRIGPIRWKTTCVITEADPGHEFAFTVVNGHGREETRWRYQIEATENGCTLTESYQFLWCPWAARVAELPFPRDKQLRRGLHQTLASLKQTAEAAQLTR